VNVGVFVLVFVFVGVLVIFGVFVGVLFGVSVTIILLGVIPGTTLIVTSCGLQQASTLLNESVISTVMSSSVGIFILFSPCLRINSPSNDPEKFVSFLLNLNST
jgi:hypothetical protein